MPASRVHTTVAVAVVSLGLGFLAGSVPNNSVGSPQLKDGQVKSVDLQNGGVTSADVKDGSLAAGDLAAGTIPAQPTAAYTESRLGGCGSSGWCYLNTAAAGTVVARFDTPPPNATDSTTTGTIVLSAPATAVITANPEVWYFGSGSPDVMCWVKDGATTILGSGWIRSPGNQTKIVTINGVVPLAAGEHPITLACRNSAGVDVAAVTRASLSVVILPTGA